MSALRAHSPAESHVAEAVVSSGFPELDQLLPNGGWLQGELTEILLPLNSVGAFRLVMPALAQLSVEQRWLSWVSPPDLPSVSALANAGVRLSCIQLVHPKAQQDGLSVVEKSLRSGTCSAVLAWPMVDDARILRRLQQAAVAGNALGFMFRHSSMAKRMSPATLRLQLKNRPYGKLAVSLVDRRGKSISEDVELDNRPALSPTPSNSRLNSPISGLLINS